MKTSMTDCVRAVRQRLVRCGLSGCVLAVAAAGVARAAAPVEADVCIYGGTSGGVIAAVQAGKMGKSVVLIEPSRHLGGMTSGGLGFVDVGHPASIGGLTRDYFHRVWQHYESDSAWPWEKRRFIQGQHGKLPPGEETMWIVEPHVAEQLFDRMAAEAKVSVVRGERLERKNGVHASGKRITELVLESGRSVRARMFIDATYEGDLLAAAGASFIIGREANSQYGETVNGLRGPHALGLLKQPLDAFVKPGDPTSGLLPRVRPAPSAPVGSADAGVQAYCYRMCLTDVAANRVIIEKPPGYDERAYEIVFRAIEAGQPVDRFFKLSLMPNRKTDSNNHSSISTDFVGMSADYAKADYAARKQIERAHEAWQRGLVWTLQNHPRVPAEVRAYYRPWGLAKDEFSDNDHWPHQLYIREARRMVGDYVMTEQNCLSQRAVHDPVGLASYTIDSHMIQYCVGTNGVVEGEGGMGTHLRRPYPISYRSLVPKASECENLLVPVCLSASHAAYGSLRMEPVFMVLGQSAATAAVLALERGVSVQQLDYAALRQRLLADHQRLEWEGTPSPPGPAGIEVDDSQATVSGHWQVSTSQSPYVGDGYLHDSNEGKGQKAIRFTPDLPTEGQYDIYLYWIKHPNRATNVPVEVMHQGGTATLVLNQRSQGGWVKVFTGRFAAGRAGSLLIRNGGTDGYVVADAARWVAASK